MRHSTWKMHIWAKCNEQHLVTPAASRYENSYLNGKINKYMIQLILYRKIYRRGSVGQIQAVWNKTILLCIPISTLIHLYTIHLSIAILKFSFIYTYRKFYMLHMQHWKPHWIPKNDCHIVILLIALDLFQSQTSWNALVLRKITIMFNCTLLHYASFQKHHLTHFDLYFQKLFHIQNKKDYLNMVHTF